MKFSATLATAILAATMPSVLSAPTDSSVTFEPADSAVTVEQRANKEPEVCKPGGATGDASHHINDQSSVCQAQGIGSGCCVTVFDSGYCRIKSQQDLDDIKNVVGQQIRKKGQFKKTVVGKWHASYDDFASHLADTRVLTEWFHVLQSKYTGATHGTFGDILFSLQGKAGFTRIRVKCY